MSDDPEFWNKAMICARIDMLESKLEALVGLKPVPGEIEAAMAVYRKVQACALFNRGNGLQVAPTGDWSTTDAATLLVWLRGSA